MFQFNSLTIDGVWFTFDTFELMTQSFWRLHNKVNPPRANNYCPLPMLSQLHQKNITINSVLHFFTNILHKIQTWSKPPSRHYFLIFTPCLMSLNMKWMQNAWKVAAFSDRLRTQCRTRPLEGGAVNTLHELLIRCEYSAYRAAIYYISSQNETLALTENNLGSTVGALLLLWCRNDKRWEVLGMLKQISRVRGVKQAQTQTPLRFLMKFQIDRWGNHPNFQCIGCSKSNPAEPVCNDDVVWNMLLSKSYKAHL